MRAARKRHVPHLHRLHAYDEGVRKRGEQQQGRRHAPDARLSLREMNRIDNRGGGVGREE